MFASIKPLKWTRNPSKATSIALRSAMVSPSTRPVWWANAGNLIQIPPERTQRAGGVPQLSELPVGERWCLAQVRANRHRDVSG